MNHPEETSRGSRATRLAALAGFLVACFVAAGIGNLVGPGGQGGWYAGLDKPAINPPSWVFGPVWTVLYITMAVSAWLVWLRRSRTRVTAPLVAFAVQLVLNAAWSPLFFGLNSLLLALLDLAAMWVAIVITIVLFWRVRRPAALLMLPYLAWVSFAGVLNFLLWRMNC